MKNHYCINSCGLKPLATIILSVLLIFTSTEILATEEAQESRVMTSYAEVQTQDSTTFFPRLTKILQSTAIVIILIVGTVFFLKRKFGLSRVVGKKYMHVVESIPIGTKRFLLLVKIPGKLLVIGMANDHINALAEITDKEVVDAVSPSSNNNDFMGFMKKVCLERRQARAVVSENNH